MSILSKELDYKVRLALQNYSEHQVCRMFNLRVAAVRAIKIDMVAKANQSVVTMNSRALQDRLQQELFDIKTVTGHLPYEFRPDLHEVPRSFEKDVAWGIRYAQDLRAGTDDPASPSMFKQDYAGLEARVLAGFFTPDGRPTPAFWGFVSTWCKKSGHKMLDMLHDQEIFAPEQLARMLDLDSRIEDMTQAEAVALLRRVTKKVYDNEFKDPGSSGADVQDGEQY